MKYNYLSDLAINKFINDALVEDIGDGDHSTLAAVPENAQKKAQLIIKGEGLLAGVSLAQKIFRTVDPDLSIEIKKEDGETVKFGDIGFVISGKARSILTSERLVLNCMQRMSGIATLTARLNSLIHHTKAQLLDTRKTTPNCRLIEKWAVKIGGGTNHRFGLFDMIMLKDNHVDFAGSITKAVQSTQTYLKDKNKELKIEVEVRNLEEVKEVLNVGGVDVIMLDNMSNEEMKEAVRMIGNTCKTEASGGITEQTIKAIAETGVDFISVGALTHSVKSMDISLKALDA
ncbi:carboxylating nicotinate-nucleotide diphosphorylase [Flexithrix dorotheae]|uniref:carboxylating nicotinate-nucleotide diphosphorylase n=1 Tax=Flexithrix dorotheae TaxID=70993 RepID=UPI000361C79F|nr:carboxylating nicotinate-nucleotide diphosphorylase [Flexithrix dorotheae]